MRVKCGMVDMGRVSAWQDTGIALVSSEYAITVGCHATWNRVQQTGRWEVGYLEYFKMKSLHSFGRVIDHCIYLDEIIHTRNNL